jgi:peptidoglycan/LPS O-acetylase OafA/YrhL
MNPQRLRHIDAWRFFAVGLVIYSHLVEFSHPFYAQVVPALVWRARPLGLLGVQIFFCISGFVICRGMLREARDHGAVDMRAFYLRRAFRILPPLLLYGLFVAVMSAAGVVNVRLPQFLQAAAFLCNVESIGNCGWYLGHTWSLAFEEQFYLAYPMAFAALGLAWHRKRLVNVLSLLTVLIVVLQLTAPVEVSRYASTFSCMLWGCLFALYYDRIEPLLQRLPMVAWLLLATGLVVINASVLPAGHGQFVYPLVAPFMICIVVLATPMRQPDVRRLFSNRTICYLGQVSYTVYLWQQAVMAPHAFSSPLTSLVLIGVVFGAACLSFKYFESPLIKLGTALARRRGVAQSSPAAADGLVERGSR